MKKVIAIIFILMFCFSFFGQNIIKETFNYEIFENGDAKVIYTRAFTASEWQQYFDFISNESMMITGLKRTFPKNFLSEFSFNKDSELRSFTISFKIFGFCDVDNLGNFKIKISKSKNAEITTLSEKEHKYMVVETNILNYSQETHLFQLPKNAKNVLIEKDDIGASYILYGIDQSIDLTIIKIILSIFLFILGIFLFFLFKRNRKI